MHVSPGDPAQKKLTAQGIAVLRRCWGARAGKMWGWTGRFFVQYGSWLANARAGDLGVVPGTACR